MRCNNAQEYLSWKIDGVLPPEKAGDLELHLEECSECREFYADLTLGLRMLAASEPQLPENFDWKLQLKLNQALKEAVGGSAYPWEDRSSGRLRWVQNFGAAAAVGLAAVLALAIFAGPTLDSSDYAPGKTLNTRPAVAAGVRWQGDDQGVAGDRRSLQPMFQSGSGLYGDGSQQRVSAGETRMNRMGSSTLNRVLQGSSLDDQRIINNLRSQVQYQNRILYQYQKEVKSLRAHLDTSSHKGVDLPKDLHEGQQ